MANLTLAVGGMWGTIINWFHSFIPSFGLTIIVFTIALKLILSPLEVYQKVMTKKQTEVQAKLQPQLEKIQKRYGNNKEMLNQKTAELYKKENFNVMGSCLGLLINLVITLVVFITLFSSLNQISQYNIKTEYSNLITTYQETFISKANETSGGLIEVTEEDTVKTIIDKINAETSLNDEQKEELINNLKTLSQKQASKKYTEIKEGFLWIKNIYRPDTYASVFPNANEYLSISNTNFKKVSEENPFTNIYGEKFVTSATAKDAFVKEFNDITGDINKTYSGWNGYLILVILSAGITVLSQIINTKATKAKKQVDKKGNEIEYKQPSNKLMLVLLPILMVIFTLQYSAAFAIYIVINSLMSLLISFVTGLIMDRIDKKKENLTKEVK